ncbi:SRPBCC family protein [Cupriavidus plantarum]|uniref:Polyketide cyclase/dehydrase/lipid transport protein n=1 Tax=Cupriavidus plantarum TaxID=942865 RepID=A0A316FGW3_9BURK|nr:SRPBCC family protein [Cupriavidus plantarum]PWK36890.1 polyketide cyclase/dehydrase/lipid transport protein [Cupriavidus plantarum]
MAKASTSIDVAVAPDAVWNLIGGFDSLPDWLPYIPESELSEGGRVRHLANPNGEAIVERLMAFDERQRSYSYAILKAPFPVTNYLSTLRVVAVDGGRKSRVEWSGEFTPNGVSDQEATAIFQKIYEDGLKALAEGLAR